MGSVRKLADDVRRYVQESTAVLRVADAADTGLFGKSPQIELVFTDPAGLALVTRVNATLFAPAHDLIGEAVPANVAAARVSSHPRVANDVRSNLKGISVLHLEVRFVTSLTLLSTGASRTVYTYNGRPIGVRFTVDGVSTITSLSGGLTFTRLSEPAQLDGVCMALAAATPAPGVDRDFFATPGSDARLHAEAGMYNNSAHPLSAAAALEAGNIESVGIQIRDRGLNRVLELPSEMRPVNWKGQPLFNSGSVSVGQFYRDLANWVPCRVTDTDLCPDAGRSTPLFCLRDVNGSGVGRSPVYYLNALPYDGTPGAANLDPVRLLSFFLPVGVPLLAWSCRNAFVPWRHTCQTSVFLCCIEPRVTESRCMQCVGVLRCFCC